MKVKLLLMLLLSAACINVSAYDLEVDGVYYVIDATKPTASVVKGSTPYQGSVAVPESITINGKTYAVTFVWGRCFSNCTELTSVKLPNSVTSLGDYLFEGSTSLTDVTLPNSITKIPLDCFKGCTSLKNIDIPSSVTYFGLYAFEGCTSLGPVFTVPATITGLGEGVWSGCTGIKTLRFADSENWVGSGSVWDDAFSGINPDSLYIGREVRGFGKKKSVKYVEFGPNLKSWGESSFVSDSTSTIVTDILDPSQIEKPTFSNYVYAHTTLYVPKGTLEIYKQADGWKEFLNIKENDGLTISGIKSITSQSSSNKDDDSWYSLSGVKLNKKPVQKGIYIHEGKKIIVKD